MLCGWGGGEIRRRNCKERGVLRAVQLDGKERKRRGGKEGRGKEGKSVEKGEEESCKNADVCGCVYWVAQTMYFFSRSSILIYLVTFPFPVTRGFAVWFIRCRQELPPPLSLSLSLSTHTQPEAIYFPPHQTRASQSPRKAELACPAS